MYFGLQPRFGFRRFHLQNSQTVWKRHYYQEVFGTVYCPQGQTKHLIGMRKSILKHLEAANTRRNTDYDFQNYSPNSFNLETLIKKLKY